MNLPKNTKLDLKQKLAKAVEGLSKEDALAFLDSYKDTIKQRNTVKRHDPAHIKNIVGNVMRKLK